MQSLQDIMEPSTYLRILRESATFSPHQLMNVSFYLADAGSPTWFREDASGDNPFFGSSTDFRPYQ